VFLQNNNNFITILIGLTGVDRIDNHNKTYKPLKIAIVKSIVTRYNSNGNEEIREREKADWENANIVS